METITGDNEDVAMRMHTITIQSLNDDILVEIFKFLPIKDRILAERGIYLF